MKTRFVCTALLFLLLASCGGEKKEQPAAKIIDPVWGLWVQQIPDGTAKFELMFNEDKSGFLFVDDALKFKIGTSSTPPRLAHSAAGSAIADCSSSLP